MFAVVALAALATTTRLSTRWRMVAASGGLVTCSAMLVHLWGGVIEAHFHVFVVIGLLTLSIRTGCRSSWPSATSCCTTGSSASSSRTRSTPNPQAAAHPWTWALVHGGFVLAASATHVASWRTNKQQLLRDGLTGLPSRLLLMSRLEASRTTSRATCVLRETVHRECRDNNGLDNRGNSPSADCVDQTRGTGTAGTANTWIDNIGKTSLPPGLCQPPPP